MTYIIPHFIEGKPLTVSSASYQDVYNPALGEVVGRVYFADQALCDKAVAAAVKAYPLWAETPPVKRARILFKFRDALEKSKGLLARMVSSEHGKTVEDAEGSVARGIEVVEHHCGLLSQMQGQFTANVASQIDCHTFRQPLGVCAGISPFNFPVMVPLWMMIPAIAAGNAFILKPSELDPSAPIKLMELLTEAGLPEGIVTCLQGNKDTVEHLLHNQHIASFTAVASTPVAQYIYQTAAQQGKRAHTFGGAKNHCVVMPDADLDSAATAIVGAAFGSAGERCMAISVAVTVGHETSQRLLEKITPLIEAIRVDAGDSPNSDMGPLVSELHRARVMQAIDKGVKEGARLLIDGRNFKHKTHPNGFYLGPSLFTEVTENMSIYQQEVFGPVLVVLQVETFEEALQLVNRNQYGNGTAIFTRDGYIAREYSERVQVGMVGVNIPIPVPIASHPFGGWKHSSFGDTNMHGLESIHFYTKLKTVTTKWFEAKHAPSAFTMPTH